MSVSYRKNKKLKRLAESPEVRAIRNKIRRGVAGYYPFVLARDKRGHLERVWTVGWRHPGKRSNGNWAPRISWRQIGFIHSIKQQEAKLADERG